LNHMVTPGGEKKNIKCFGGSPELAKRRTPARTKIGEGLIRPRILKPTAKGNGNGESNEVNVSR